MNRRSFLHTTTLSAIALTTTEPQVHDSAPPGKPTHPQEHDFNLQQILDLYHRTGVLIYFDNHEQRQ